MKSNSMKQLMLCIFHQVRFEWTVDATMLSDAHTMQSEDNGVLAHAHTHLL